MQVKKLFSERALENEEFERKVIEPTAYIFNVLEKYVSNFTDLTNLDTVPYQFMRFVGELYGFPYLDTEDIAAQKEIYKRIVKAYKEKGSLGLFEKALSYAYTTAYAYGSLSYYRNAETLGTEALEPAVFRITYPRDEVLILDEREVDESRCSSNLYSLGVIIIEAEDRIRNSARVRQYLDSLIPAGIRYELVPLS